MQELVALVELGGDVELAHELSQHVQHPLQRTPYTFRMQAHLSTLVATRLVSLDLCEVIADGSTVEDVAQSLPQFLTVDTAREGYGWSVQPHVHALSCLYARGMR